MLAAAAACAPLFSAATNPTPAPSSSPAVHSGDSATKPTLTPMTGATAPDSKTPAPSPSPGEENQNLVPHRLPDIHAEISIPKDWTLIADKLLEGGVLVATREKIKDENDVWTTGLSMTIDRNGSKDSGQKASVYALGLAQEAREKAGEEASPLKESGSGARHEVRFDFPVPGDQPLQVTEVLRSNDDTGTLTVILWQTPKDDSQRLEGLRESVLAGLKLDGDQ